MKKRLKFSQRNSSAPSTARGESYFDKLVELIKGLKPAALCFILTSLVFVLVASCGSKDKEDSDPGSGASPSKTPTKKPSVSPSPTVIPDTGSLEFFVGSNVMRTLVRFDNKGAVKTPWIDFKAAYGSEGGVVSYASLNETNKLVAFDPGVATKSESIALIDPLTGVVKNKNWFLDTALDQVTISGMAVGFIANTLLVGTSQKVVRVLYDANFAASGSASNFLLADSLADCPHTVVEDFQLVKKGNVKTLVLLSSGANARINLITLNAGAASCSASLDYAAAGGPTSSADVPVSSTVMGDGDLYVLFQNATASKIVKYTFTGTAISNPRLVFSDQTLLGAKPKGLFARSSLRLLFSNTVDDKIYEVTTAGAFTGFFLDNSFTQDVSLIVAP